MSLHIALVLPYCLDSPGGVAQHVLGLARWLIQRGHHVQVIAPGTRPVDEAFPVHLLGGATPLRFNGSTAELALSRGQAKAALALVAKADVAHVHEPLTPGVGHAVARASQPLVVTHHAAFSQGLARCVRPLGRRLPRRVAIAVSQAAADTAYAATGRRPRVVPNGIELPKAPSGQRDETVVFIGRRDDPRKGYAHFGRLARSIPHARFVAVGPGHRTELAVEELGLISDESKHDVLGRARILVAPHTFGESFGVTIVEALAYGCAVVGYGLASFRAVVDDPSVSTWVPIGDLHALREGVVHRLARPIDPVQAWRSAAPFSWDDVGPRVEDAYRAALRGHDIG